MHGAGGNLAVALIAQRVDGRHVQQTRVLRAMGGVAGDAAFGLDRGVLENKGTTLLHVALGADGILIGSGLDIVLPEGAVRIVAVAAGNQAFFNLVVEGHGELRLDFGVALEAELGLRSLEEMILVLALVNAMAAYAADIGLGVRRAGKVRMRAGMAAEAFCIDILGGSLGGIEDLGLVAAAVHVLFARAMAVFAGHADAIVHGRGFIVLVAGKALGDFFVTSGASLAADKIARRSFFGWCILWLVLGSRSSPGGRCEHDTAQQQHPTHSQSRHLARDRTQEKLRNRPNSTHQYHLGCFHYSCFRHRLHRQSRPEILAEGSSSHFGKNFYGEAHTLASTWT